MLHCAVVCCSVLHYTVVYCSALCYTALNYTALLCAVLFCTALPYSAQYYIPQSVALFIFHSITLFHPYVLLPVSFPVPPPFHIPPFLYPLSHHPSLSLDLCPLTAGASILHSTVYEGLQENTAQHTVLPPVQESESAVCAACLGRHGAPSRQGASDLLFPCLRFFPPLSFSFQRVISLCCSHRTRHSLLSFPPSTSLYSSASHLVVHTSCPHRLPTHNLPES
jgi:hypothetical protein